MSARRARLAVFLTSVALAFVAGSLTMLSLAAPRRAVAETSALPKPTAPPTAASAPDSGDLYLPQLDPQADLCQG